MYNVGLCLNQYRAYLKSLLLYVCVFVLFICNQLCTIVVLNSSLSSSLNLLLLSVKNAGLHVYNMDILYTAKHAGPNQTPLLSALSSTSHFQMQL